MISLDALIDRYTATVEHSDEILTILYPDLSSPPPFPLVRGAMRGAADYILDRWASGRKSVRTQMAVDVIPAYPEEVLTTSLLLDALVNLLDDLIDEMLTKEEQGQLILELLRVIALLNEAALPAPLRLQMAAFIYKGAVIAVAEQFYYPQIQDSVESRAQVALNAYLARSIDVDFFFRLPLAWRLGVEADLWEVLALARIAWSLALLYKDCGDGDHDRTHRTPSPVLLLGRDGGTIGDVVQGLVARATEVAEPEEPWLREVADNLRRRIEVEEMRCLALLVGGEGNASIG